VNVADVPATRGCRDSALSPDAKFLACFDSEMNLSLYDVSSGETVFKKEKFFDFDPGFSGYDGIFKFFYFLMHPHVTVLRFSPDSRYFAASSRTHEEVVMDLTTLKKINVPGSIHTLMDYSFSFIGPDRMVGVNASSPQKSILAEFPSGKVIDHLPLGGGDIVAAANPNFLLIRPVGDRPVGVYDVGQKKFVISNRTAALDVWGDVSASERLDSEIGLYKVGETTTTLKLQLPLGKLGALSTFTASPDLKYVAFSGRTRGALWNLETNARLFYMRGFRNIFYAPNTTFFVEFPEFEKAEHEMAVLSPVTMQSKSRPVEKGDEVTFFGNVLLRTKHNDKDKRSRKNFELAALDMATQSPLWSHTFPKQGPSVSGAPSSGKVVFLWQARSDGLRDELAREPGVQAAWNKANPGPSDFFAQVLDARDGRTAGGAVIHTGKYSILPERVEATADWLTVVDNVNRVLLYSLSTGEQKAKWFGYAPRVSPNGDRLCLANGRGHLVLYDLRSLKKVRDLYFANPVSAHLFSGDGKKLFVLTNDQTAFVLDASGGEETAFTQPR
jgi:WD40 repeat protein